MGILARLHSVLEEATLRLDQLSERGMKTWVEEEAALRLLQVQAQALLDMVLRLASSLGYTPTNTREASRALLAEGVISEHDYELLKKIAGFRNILVHEYTAIDRNLVRRILEEREYRRPVLLASKLLEKAIERGIDP